MAKGLGVIRHTHKYMKNEYGLWSCMRDGCTHFMPSNVEHSIIGRKSICWNCGDEFTLTMHAIRNKRPQCDDCNPEVQEAINIADKLDEFLNRKK